jgi:DUF1009 family protein
LEVGTTFAIKDREMIAVEAAEGVEQLIIRAGRLCRCGGWVLIKTGKMLPGGSSVLVPQTIGLLREAGGACLAFEDGSVRIDDKPALLVEADRLGIVVVALHEVAAV